MNQLPKILKNKKLLPIFIVLVLMLAFVPTHSAHAACIAGFFPVTDCIMEGLGYLMSLIFAIIGQVIAFLAIKLNQVINTPVYPAQGIAVVDESWKVMRNFANMFFIVALIVMAYATIFDISKYNAKALFAKFLIAAILINFSLVLGVLVIKGSQVLSNTFLTAIGDMSGRLGQGLASKILPNTADVTTTSAAISQTIQGGVLATIIQLIFSLVLGMTFLFSLLTAFIFALARIPIIWALLIVSPLAIIATVFPGLQDRYAQWQKAFIGWNLFLPIYLFFLYFGLYFLQNQDDVMRSINSEPSNATTGNVTGDILQSVATSITFQTLFYYVMAAGFLIGGTMIAMKMSMFAGTSVTKVAGFAKDRASSMLGLTAARKAAMGRLEEIRKEGLPGGLGRIYGGEAADARREARFKDIIGGITGGRTNAADKQLETEVGLERSKQTQFANDITKLRELMTSGSRAQRLAASERLTQMNALSGDEIQQVYRLAGGDRSEVANKYIASVDFGKLTKDEREDFSTKLTNVEAKKKNAAAMIEKDKLDAAEVTRLAESMGIRNAAGTGFVNTEEIKDFLNKGNKKNLLAVVQARINLGLAETTNIDREIEGAIKKLTDDQISEMVSDPKFDIASAEGQKIMGQLKTVFKSNPRRLENIVAKSSGDVRAKLDPLVRDLRKERATPLGVDRAKKYLATKKAKQELANIDYEMDMYKNNPNSSTFIDLRQQRTDKQKEVTSLMDEMKKIDDKIKNINAGTPLTP